MPTDPRRILVVACAWIGDTFWAAQLVPALAERFPDAELHLGVKPASVGLVGGLPAQVHALPWVTSDRRREAVSWRGLVGHARALRRVGFDAVVDVTGTRYSAALVWGVGGWSVGFGGDPLGWVYSVRVAVDPVEHLARRPWRVAAPLLGCAPQAPRPLPRTSEGLGGDPYVVLAPGAGWPGKRWPLANFMALAERLRGRGVRVVAVGGSGDEGACRSIGEAVVGRPLEEVAGVLGGAAGVVCNDSALGHVAAAEGVPVVALFNATHPESCGPLGERVCVVRAPCPHRPEGVERHCHGVPAYPCPPRCWAGVTVEQVEGALRRLGV